MTSASAGATERWSRALDAFARDGIATLEGVFTSSECGEMRSLLDAAIADATEGLGRTWRGFSAEQQVVTDASGSTVFALWDTYERCQALIPFTEHPSIVAFAEHALGGPALRATSGTMFDKVDTGDAQIGPHQDAFFQLVPADGGLEAAAAVKSPHAVNHLGVLHVHPQLISPFTEDLFLRCLTVRINIDIQTEESGCLRVLPNSHQRGPFEILSDAQALEKYVETHAGEEIVCEAGEGSVTFYRPLLIHSSKAPAGSSSDTGTGRRRVLAHRVRAADLEIPGWSWPSHWTGVTEPLRPAERWAETARAMPARL